LFSAPRARRPREALAYLVGKQRQIFHLLPICEDFTYHPSYVRINRSRLARARRKKDERADKTGRHGFADHPRSPEKYSVLQIEGSNAPAHFHSSESILHQHSDGERADSAGHGRKITRDLCRLARVHVAYERVAVLCERRAPLLVIAEQSLKVALIRYTVCAYVYDNGAGLYVLAVDHCHTAYRGNQYVSRARDSGEVRRARMADGHGRVTVQEEQRYWKPDYAAATEYDRARAFDLNFVAVEHLDYTSRRAGPQARLAYRQLPEVYSVESVHVFCWVHGI
jgi:hypothetical protein